MNAELARVAEFCARATGFGVVLISTDAIVQWRTRARISSSAQASAGSPACRTSSSSPRKIARSAQCRRSSRSRATGLSEDDRWHCRADGARFWANGVLSALRNDEHRLVGYGKVVRNRTDAKEQLVALRSEHRAGRDVLDPAAAVVRTPSLTARPESVGQVPRLSAQLTMQPGTRQRPVAADGALRDIECSRGLGVVVAGEVTALDDLRQP